MRTRPRKSLCLDISTWRRGPNTAVGLCALRMTREIFSLAGSHDFDVEVFSRDALDAETRKDFLAKTMSADTAPLVITWAPMWRRWFAKLKGQIFISFDHRLPPVCGAKKIIVVHDAWTLRKNPWQRAKFQRDQHPKVLSAIASADMILCPSQTVAEEVLPYQRQITTRVHVLPWGPMVDADADTELNFESRTLVMIATLERRKNHDFAFRLATALGPTWHWIFVGANGHGSEDAKLEITELVDRGYQVQHLQRLNPLQITQVYREAFAVICPSFEEGFGLTVLESLALGRPVFASNIRTHAEVAQNCAQYFDPVGSDVAAVAETIKKMARTKSEYEEQVMRGFGRAKDFSWRSSAERLISLLSDL